MRHAAACCCMLLPATRGRLIYSQVHLLEIRYTVSPYRGFESLLLRQRSASQRSVNRCDSQVTPNGTQLAHGAVFLACRSTLEVATRLAAHHHRRRLWNASFEVIPNPFWRSSSR